MKPVVAVHVQPQESLDGLNVPLGRVSLLMICANELAFNVQLTHELIPELRNKARIAISNQPDRQETSAHKGIKEKIATLASISVGDRGAKDNGLGENVHDHHASVERSAERKAKNDVHTNRVKCSVRDLVWGHATKLVLSGGLDPLTVGAATHIFLDHIRQTRTIELSFHKGPRLVETPMTEGVMSGSQHTAHYGFREACC